MKRTTTIVLAVIVFTMFVSTSFAQVRKTKPKAAKRTASTQPSTEPSTEPLIISRAQDYPLDGSVLSSNVADAVRVADLQDSPPNERLLADLNERIKSLEAQKKEDPDQRSKRLLLNLDILAKAEQRVESLRKQSFELLDRENAIRTKLDQLEIDLRPESIDRQIAFAGSLRPEELRAARKRSLETERTNQQNLLIEIQRTRAAIDANVQKADILVERLRVKLESEIDIALTDPPIKP